MARKGWLLVHEGSTVLNMDLVSTVQLNVHPGYRDAGDRMMIRSAGDDGAHLGLSGEDAAAVRAYLQLDAEAPAPAPAVPAEVRLPTEIRTTLEKARKCLTYAAAHSDAGGTAQHWIYEADEHLGRILSSLDAGVPVRPETEPAVASCCEGHDSARAARAAETEAPNEA